MFICHQLIEKSQQGTEKASWWSILKPIFVSKSESLHWRWYPKVTLKSPSISRLADIQRVKMCKACNPCQHIYAAPICMYVPSSPVAVLHLFVFTFVYTRTHRSIDTKMLYCRGQQISSHKMMDLPILLVPWLHIVKMSRCADFKCEGFLISTSDNGNAIFCSNFYSGWSHTGGILLILGFEQVTRVISKYQVWS